jgi:hypothetical protein
VRVTGGNCRHATTQAYDIDGCGAVCGFVITQLAAIVATPALDAASGGQGAGVIVPGSHLNNIIKGRRLRHCLYAPRSACLRRREASDDQPTGQPSHQTDEPDNAMTRTRTTKTTGVKVSVMAWPRHSFASFPGFSGNRLDWDEMIYVTGLIKEH